MRADIAVSPVREQYWQAIVGDQWPVLGPSEWHRLEAIARAGAAALDADGVSRVVDEFDHTVRSSVRLRGALAEMRARQNMPRTFASALAAAADTFGDLAELAHRTRNRISDIVDRAVQRIEATPGADDAVRARQLISAIVVSARTEVIDVVTEAAEEVNRAGLPGLRRVAELLGDGPLDAPLPADPPGATAYPESSPGSAIGTGGAPSTSPAVPSPPGIIASAHALPNQQVAQQDHQGGAAADGTPDADSIVPDHRSPASSGVPPAGRESVVAEHPGAATAGPRNLISDGPGIEPDAPATTTASGTAAGGALEDQEGRNAAGDLSAESALLPGGTVLPAALIPPSGGRQPPIAGHRDQSPVPAPRVAPTASAPGPSAAAARGAGRRSEIPRSPGAPQRSGVPQSPAVVPGVTVPEDRKGRPPTAHASNSPDGPTAVASNAPDHSSANPDPLGDVVRAALIPASGSAHILGDQVDGDLVLARSLLAGILHAAPPPAVWAVATMRHPDGITVFATSNEGAGYLPAGLYLPSEISRPWGWKLAEEAIWEEISDPARVLAEFGSVRGLRSGARLTAIVSSIPVAPALRRELPDLPLEGEVSAAADLDLTAPGAGRVDRLELTMSPDLVRRIAAVPDTAIVERRARMARAAHAESLARGQDGAVTMDAPGLRGRILRAWQAGAAVEEQCWQDLRDVDDLLAATLLGQQVDVSRVPLGELRSDPERGHADLTRLRRIVLERRCNELVLRLAETPTRQSLRDAVYAYAQTVPLRSEPHADAAVAPSNRRPDVAR
ncbi:hypothetical protein [Nocardia colli]|uniref:hypothetical protein n=1 Tax=Nocardia colli TaxID=2545717 RepID=UPI0035D55F34